MGTRLQITSVNTKKHTDDCGKFYGYCDYKDAMESFDFLIDLYKQGKIKFDEFVEDAILNNDEEEAFIMFTTGGCFGDIILSNEDFIKFIDLHNKEAWTFWMPESSYENWYFKKQCDELAQIIDNKYLLWS